MRRQDWIAIKMKAVETYFEQLPRGRSGAIALHVVESVKNCSGRPARNCAMNTKEVGMLLRKMHFIRDEDGFWYPSKKWAATRARAAAALAFEQAAARSVLLEEVAA